jgi:hypothetical protein
LLSTNLSLKISVAEPEPHHLVGAGAVTQCGSGGSGYENGIKHGWESKNDTKRTFLVGSGPLGPDLDPDPGLNK